MAHSIVVTAAGSAGSMFLGAAVAQAVATKTETKETRIEADIKTKLEAVSGRNAEPDYEAMLLRAWQMAEERHGPDDLAVGSALANLAEYYQSRGRSAEADECDRRIRVILNQFLASVA